MDNGGKTKGGKVKPLKIVIPDGSMQEVVTNLLAKAGLPIKEGKIAVPWVNEVSPQRPQEIPHYLKGARFDVGIVGEDWIANWGYEFPVLLKLPIGRSGNKPVKIVLAVKKDSGFKSVQDLPRFCEVATEYVPLTERFFREAGREDILVMSSYGKTEQKIDFGASAIVDVTESGKSLKKNGLVVIAELMESNTVLVVNPTSYSDMEKRPYIDCLVALLKGAYQASQYIMLIANVPEKAIGEASKIIGGLKGASKSPLMVDGWFALQSIVLRENEHDIIFKLLQIGVTDIIVNRDIPLIMS